MELTLGLAFAAGLISFISPCVLPLVPAYITYMGGRVTNTVAAQASSGGNTPGGALTRVSTGIHSLFFVLGFSLVFVGLGLLSTSFVQVVGGSNINAVTRIIGRAGGIVIILFGLHFMGALTHIFNWFRQRKGMLNALFSVVVFAMGSLLIFWAFDIPPSRFSENANLFNRVLVSLPVFTAFIMWLALSGAFTQPRAFWLNLFDNIEGALYADTRQDMTASGQSGFSGTAFMGVVFAAGWTPCIGPIYGAILTLAANGGNVTQSGAMLLAYSLGLGIPFILTALLLDSAQGVLRNLNRHMGTIKMVSGVFLIAIGLLVASGQLQRLSAWGSTGELGEMSFRMEECFTDAVSGEVAWGSVISCVNDSGDETAPETLSSTAADETTANTAASAANSEDAVANADQIGTEEGMIAPNFTTVTAEGDEIALQDLRGQTVLLNFWATWCGPCRIEMPEFQEAYEQYQDEGFTVVAVNNRESVSQVTDFRDELDLTFPLVMDERGDIQTEYGILNYPSTFLINEDGVIVNKHLGPLTAERIGEMITEAVG